LTSSLTPTLDTDREGFLSSLDFPVRPENPRAERERITRVAGRLYVSGALEFDLNRAAAQLQTWIDEGVTHYLAAHHEFDFADFIRENSDIEVIHLGVDDHLGRQDLGWFDRISEAANRVFANPDHKLVASCYLGVNRGPSAAMAILVARGWTPLQAMRAIRKARPIANLAYARDVARWSVLRNDGTELEARAAEAEVNAWFARHPLAAGEMIREIYGRRGW